MKRIADQLQVSASDLSNGLGCGHLTELEHQVAQGALDAPAIPFTHVLRALQQQGRDHEQAFLDHLEASGVQVARVVDEEQVGASALDQTRTLMAQGAEVIFQAHLVDEDGTWAGRADFLMRVEQSTDLGAHGYEVLDTKLATETRAGTILQLCLYSDLVARVQGRQPKRMHVVTPGEGFTPHAYRTDDFQAYYRLARRNLIDRLGDTVLSYPEPVEQCDLCRWWERCDKRRRTDDHLSLVAGISRSQRTELLEHDLPSLQALAEAPALDFKPSRGSRESLAKVKKQAEVQFRGRLTQQRVHELIRPVEPDRGFNLLPEPSDGDLFLDLEGDQFVGNGGLEYLFGWGFELDGQWHYEHRWAHDAAGERAAFEHFMQLATQRIERDPAMHIYHYAPYEPSALKRLAGRYGTCVEELDELLRAERFVDLYRVVRQGVVASVERYSIKDLEPFFVFSRQVELREVGAHKRAIEGLLQLGKTELLEESVEVVRQYNEDDCHATLALRDWLEQQRKVLADEGEPLQRPQVQEAEPSDNLSEWLARIQPLERALLEDLPEAEEDRDVRQQARWLLAHMLRWHKREENAVWWERFRLAELEADDLLDERKALGGLSHEAVIDGRVYQPGMRSPAHRYRFEPQDVDLRPGTNLLQPIDKFPKFGEILGIDPVNGWVDLKLPKKVDPHSVSALEGLFESKLVGAKTIAKCLEKIASAAVDDAGDIGAQNPLADKLLRKIPMAGLPVELAETWHIVDHLAGDVLPVQGPPGSGKSYSGARMILRLVQAGKKVGITATSHAVIDNLMRKVHEAAVKEGLTPPRMLHKDSGRGDEVLRRSDDNAAAVAALENGEVDVLGGTAWLWGHEDRHGLVHTLFVDEAGQMSLTNAIACSVAADNMVLLGDPQQLSQPLKASHPDGVEVSALQHLIGEHQTLPDERGLFLAHTYRMHPDITGYISKLYYEGRLGSAPGREKQRIGAVPGLDGTGLRLSTVEHTGNASRSHEEVARVRELADRLLAAGTFTDHEGHTRTLTPDDILVVAPFNAQVHALQQALPNFPIGTVDKFQGQEAPVVIYSMTSSSAEDAPRGMEFLYDPHRFNVAVSRARALVILVAHPSLFDPPVGSPRQMLLANALALYAEMQGPG